MTRITVGRTVRVRSEEERIHIDLTDSQLNPDEARDLIERVEEQLTLLEGGAVTPETPATDEIDVDGHPPDEMMGSPEYHTQQDEDGGGDPDDDQDEVDAEEAAGSEDDVGGCACPECGEEFESERGVNIHRTKAHGDDEDGEHECPTCGDVFGSSVGMKTHHHKAHGVTVDERSDDTTAAAEGNEDGPEPEADEDEREETDREQKGDDDRVDDDARNFGGNPADTEVSCPVCGEVFGNPGPMRSHRDDAHDETEVARAYREQVREDLPRNVSIADVEQSVAAHGTLYEVQQDLRVPRGELKTMINKLQLTDALEEHSETQAIHMIEDLHDEFGIDEPVPEVPATDGGESA